MKRNNERRGRLNLEQLECRLVPAITVSEPNGVLTVSGDPVGTLTVTQTAQGVWQVADSGGMTLNNISANGGVRITTQGSDDTIILNNGGAFTISGNVFIDSGNGDDTVTIENAGATMTIAGLLQINTGSGDDAVTIANGGAVTVQGTTTINLGSGTNDSLDLGNTNSAIIQGDLLVQDANIISLNASSQVTGKMTVLWTEVATTANNLTTGATNLIGSLSVIGSAGADNVSLDGTIQNAASINLGNGNNNLTTAAAATSLIQGSLTYTGGTGDDVVLLQGTVNGSATVNLGSSDGALPQSFTLGDGTMGRIKGALTLSAAGGPTSMTLAAGSRLDGNLLVTTSSTDNTLDVEGAVNGSTFSYNGGGGMDVVTWGATAGSVRFSVNLGAGNDTFNLNSAFYSGGTIDGGTGTDTFTNTAAIMNLMIKNFEM